MPGNATGQRVPVSGASTGNLGWSLSRYDLVLATIPLAFGVALLAGVVLEVSLSTALALASVLALGMILDCVYWNPPVQGHDSDVVES